MLIPPGLRITVLTMKYKNRSNWNTARPVKNVPN